MRTSVGSELASFCCRAMTGVNSVCCYTPVGVTASFALSFRGRLCLSCFSFEFFKTSKCFL